MNFTAERPVVTTADPQGLIEPALFDRLSRRIDKEHGVGRLQAERMVAQALAFLKACADAPGQALSPSARVDIGWHTFILYTKEYADFCTRIGGRFIHHEPEDVPGVASEPAMSVRDRTLTAIRRSGFAVDAELWRDDGKCSNGGGPGGPGGGCHEGCHDSA